MGDLEFIECYSCGLKPGTPPLCGCCLHNRRVIEIANTKIKKLNSVINLITDIIELRRRGDE